VDFLKNPLKYTKMGAKIPRGVLLIGSSGVGKTLLARSVAGEASVPFFSCSASSFVEMFVGVGASRIRDLFIEARKSAPCIVFIDEIDTIGRSRMLNSTKSDHEVDQTINQLLTEMDGFDGESGVIVMAATNRFDVLDSALLRPGRFDRHINIDLPDYMGRIAILHIHVDNKPIDNDILKILSSMAKTTAGFSGADLANLANEAAISAVRNNQQVITHSNFEEALDVICIGKIKKNAVVTENKRKILAIHESGHALAAIKVGNYDVVKKISILPRSRSAGITMFEPSIDRIDNGLVSKSYMENQLVVMLAGRVAEEITFGDKQVTTGASNDMKVVEQIARSMVTRYGLTEKFSCMTLTEYSGQTSYEIDVEVRKIVMSAYSRTKLLLSEDQNVLNRLATTLLEKNVLYGDEIRAIVATKKMLL